MSQSEAAPNKFRIDVEVASILNIENAPVNRNINTADMHARVTLVDWKTGEEMVIDTSADDGSKKYVITSVKLWEK